MADNAYVVPFPIISPRASMGRGRAQRNPSLTGTAVYQHGDLVEVDSNGQLRKCTQTTAANIGRLAFASTDYDLSPLDPTRHAYQAERGEPIEILPRDHTVVFTYQGNTSNTGNHVFTEADLDAVLSQAKRELVFNGTQGVLTIRNTSSNPNVILKRVYDEGQVGDTNVRVECQILDDFRMERQ